MTVSYQYDVASSTSGGFIRLLFRWRGSVWKLVYREMVAFTITYFTLTMLYRFALSDFQKKIFERIVFFCSTFMDLIPLSFVLGFYVSFIASRWWSQYQAIPWPDKIMNSIALYVPGADESSRVLRRTLMRYLNVALVLVLRSISMAVKRRFPTREHLIEAGFMTRLELEMLQSVPSTEFNTFWIPCTWFVNLLREAKQEARITDSNGLKLIMEEFNEFRSKCGMLWSYDWISMPLVYTQVVTLATYAFFGACIFGRQYVDEAKSAQHRFELYIPVFTIFQLFFYMGLLKVAEQLINPFGDDDEDFELNWIIDRHMKVSYLGVDLLNTRPPPLTRDNYFYEQDMKLPYTEASLGYKKKTYRGSVARMHIPQEKQNLLVPEFTEDDDEDRIAATFGLGDRGASLWTLVGGKLNTRFSVSNQNLDQVSLESGSGNWKVSNPSLFNTPVEDVYMEQPGYVVPDMTPTENVAPADNDVIRRQSNHLPSLTSETPIKKPILKKGIKVPSKRKLLPNLKRRTRNAQKGWVAFQSVVPRELGSEAPLSLIHQPSLEKLPSEHDSETLVPNRTTLQTQSGGPIRRMSFDVGNIVALSRRVSETPSLRFQSLPDVQQFAAITDDNKEQDNDSTSNLLLMESDEDDNDSTHSQQAPPQLVFTRASISPSGSSDVCGLRKDKPDS